MCPSLPEGVFLRLVMRGLNSESTLISLKIGASKGNSGSHFAAIFAGIEHRSDYSLMGMRPAPYLETTIIPLTPQGVLNGRGPGSYGDPGASTLEVGVTV